MAFLLQFWKDLSACSVAHRFWPPSPIRLEFFPLAGRGLPADVLLRDWHPPSSGLLRRRQSRRARCEQHLRMVAVDGFDVCAYRDFDGARDPAHCFQSFGTEDFLLVRISKKECDAAADGGNSGEARFRCISKP